LSAGYIEDGCAVCPWHNWPFHLDTGQLKGSNAVSIAVYRARILQHETEPAIVEADLSHEN
jgi:nitrite reductase/ring-hydroxylating ferredoxin subunit